MSTAAPRPALHFENDRLVNPSEVDFVPGHEFARVVGLLPLYRDQAKLTRRERQAGGLALRKKQVFEVALTH